MSAIDEAGVSAEATVRGAVDSDKTPGADGAEAADKDTDGVAKDATSGDVAMIKKVVAGNAVGATNVVADDVPAATDVGAESLAAAVGAATSGTDVATDAAASDVIAAIDDVADDEVPGAGGADAAVGRNGAGVASDAMADESRMYALPASDVPGGG